VCARDSSVRPILNGGLSMLGSCSLTIVGNVNGEVNA
jgi:hypothetical protein